MPYVPYDRACLLIPYGERPHLFVILNRACKDGLCLLVMISSIKDGRPYDPACILKKGEHEFIAHDSYVVYRLAETSPAHHIASMVEKKYYSVKPDASTTLFSRIVTGLQSSDETRPRILNYAKSVSLY